MRNGPVVYGVHERSRSGFIELGKKECFRKQYACIQKPLSRYEESRAVGSRLKPKSHVNTCSREFREEYKRVCHERRLMRKMLDETSASQGNPLLRPTKHRPMAWERSSSRNSRSLQRWESSHAVSQVTSMPYANDSYTSLGESIRARLGHDKSGQKRVLSSGPVHGMPTSLSEGHITSVSRDPKRNRASPQPCSTRSNNKIPSEASSNLKPDTSKIPGNAAASVQFRLPAESPECSDQLVEWNEHMSLAHLHKCRFKMFTLETLPEEERWYLEEFAKLSLQRMILKRKVADIGEHVPKCSPIC